MSDAAALAALFAPRAVAVVGASDRPGAPGGYVLANLRAQGFAGEVFPVHPGAARVGGLPAFPSVAAIPGGVEAAVICLPAARAAEAVDAAGAAGVRAAVVLAAGFAETGAAGARAEAALAAAARRHGMALCGPNCLGLAVPGTGLALFSSTLPAPMPRGRVAVVSQSGAAAIALAQAGRIAVSALVSAGNCAVTGIAEYLTHFAADPGTGSVGLVLEGAADRDALAAAVARLTAAGKTLVALQAGRSAAGARVVRGHTGTRGKARAGLGAALEAAGAIVAPDADSLLETLVLADALGGRRTARPGVAVLGVSGGALAQAADGCAAAGLPLARLSPATAARLAALLPAFAPRGNPVDTTGAVFGDADLYAAVLTTLAEDPAVGAILAVQDAPPGLDGPCIAEYAGIARGLAAFAEVSPVPLVCLSTLSAGHHTAFRALLGPVPALHGLRPGLFALARLLARR